MLVESNMSSVLENYCYSKEISEDALNFLEACWLNSLNKSHYNRFPRIAPAWICDEARIPRDNYWIICNAAILDRLRPISIGFKRRDQIIEVLRYAGIYEIS